MYHQLWPIPMKKNESNDILKNIVHFMPNAYAQRSCAHRGIEAHRGGKRTARSPAGNVGVMSHRATAPASSPEASHRSVGEGQSFPLKKIPCPIDNNDELIDLIPNRRPFHS